MKRNNLYIVLVVAVFVTLMLSSCKKDDNPVAPPGTGSTAYVGTLSNIAGTESGTITLNIPNAKIAVPAGDTVNVSGTIYMASGDTVLLSGIYIRSTGYLSVSGSGYSLVGIISGGHFNGTYTGPNGAGGVTATPSTGQVKVYCGHYNETTPDTSNHGNINIVVDGNNISVIVSGAGVTFYGTISGTEVTVFVSGTSGAILATGTITGDSMSGAYNTGEEQGEWNATLCH